MKPKHIQADTWDCHNCFRLNGTGETYFAKGDGPYSCSVCGVPLVKRKDGAEPFEGVEVLETEGEIDAS